MMELELMGDKRMKGTRDEEREEEAFRCRETPSMFIISAHLQGYKRNSIEIIIKEEGRDQKLVIKSKNVEEILGFRKVFKIPNGVVFLDQIKAEYSEEECVLKICMPKFVKQICGAQIEEVQEEEEEEFGNSSSSHKVIKQFQKVELIENPNNEDEREEDYKEETDEEVKNSSEEVEKNVGEESQEVISNNKDIMIQSSLEESDNEVVLIGREDDEETIIGRIKEKGIEDGSVEVKEGTKDLSLPVDETDITSEGKQEQTDIEEPMLFGDVKDKERSQAKKEVEEALFEATGNEESQDSDVKLMRSSQLESTLGTHNNNHEVIGKRESHGEHEIEVEEVDEHGLEDIKVEAVSSEEGKANEQREEVLFVEMSKEIHNEELEDIKVEEDIIKAKEQRDDEVYVEISQEVEERRERQFRENDDEERKKSHGPLFIAGSAFVVSLVVFFIRSPKKVK